MTKIITEDTKYYLSGPMTGYYNYNFATFAACARTMRMAGMNVLSPHELDHGEEVPGDSGKSWEEYMKPALGMLMDADAIVMIKGWTRSRGAKKELDLALSLSMPVFLYTGATPWPIQNIG